MAPVVLRPELSILTCRFSMKPGCRVAAWFPSAGSPPAHRILCGTCTRPLLIRLAPCERNELRTLGFEHELL
jgi:hypothetical protein